MDNPHHPQSYTSGSSFFQMVDEAASQSDATADPNTSRDLVAFIFTQMSAKAGIQKHGKDAREALLKEARQLNNKSAFRTFDATH